MTELALLDGDRYCLAQSGIGNVGERPVTGGG